jgi:hypothetical protein
VADVLERAVELAEVLAALRFDLDLRPETRKVVDRPFYRPVDEEVDEGQGLAKKVDE